MIYSISFVSCNVQNGQPRLMLETSNGAYHKRTTDTIMSKAKVSEFTLAERFWPRVNKTEAGCWEWVGPKNPDGYGEIYLPQLKKNKRAHRLSYEITNGPIPAGLCVCHKCDNPSCVNPDHLFLGTHKENMEDRTRKGRTFRGHKPKNPTHFNCGHERIPENTGIVTVRSGPRLGGKPQTYCKICHCNREKERFKAKQTIKVKNKAQSKAFFVFTLNDLNRGYTI